MNPLFKLIDALNAHNSPNRTAGGITLGALLGLSPFLSLQGVAGVIALLSLRINLVGCAVSFLLFWLLQALLVSEWHALGVLMLESPALAPIWIFIDNTPLLPFLRLTESHVLGAFTVGIALAAPLFALSRYAYTKLQKPLYRWLWEQPFFRNTMGTRLYRLYANYKRKETLRWSGLATASVLLLLGGLYLSLFSGWHLRQQLERVSTQLNGADVSIESIRWTPFSSKMTLTNVRFANYRNPMQNFLEIGTLLATLRPSLLLTGRLLIEEVTASNLAYDTDRTLSGAVELPPMVPEYSAPAQASALYGSVRAAIHSNPLVNLGLEIGTRDFEGTIREEYPQLQLSQQIRQLQRRLNDTGNEFLGLETQLPSARDLTHLREQFRDPDTSGAAPPPAQTLERHLESANKVHAAMQKRLAELEQDLFQVVAVQDADKTRLREALGIPDLDRKDLTDALFGDKLLNAIERISAGMLWLRQLAGPGERVASAVWQKRELGRYHAFYTFDKVAPRLWVKKGTVGSKTDSAQGTFGDLSSSPSLSGSVFRAQISGSIPSSNVGAFSISMQADHRAGHQETLKVKVDSFPLKNWQLQASRGLDFEIESGEGRMTLEMELEEKTLEANFELNLSGMRAIARSRNQKVEEILKETVRAHGNTHLTGKITGTFSDLRLALRSPLGAELADRIEDQFDSYVRVMESNMLEAFERFAFEKSLPLKTQLDRLKKKNFRPASSTLKALNELKAAHSRPVS